MKSDWGDVLRPGPQALRAASPEACQDIDGALSTLRGIPHF